MCVPVQFIYMITKLHCQKAGAILTEDLSKANIILGIKEVPQEALMKDKTYIFFSHTHKGNKKNMPMLQSILDKVHSVYRLIFFIFLTPSWEISYHVEHTLD